MTRMVRGRRKPLSQKHLGKLVQGHISPDKVLFFQVKSIDILTSKYINL